MSEVDDNLVAPLARGGPLEDYRRRASFDWKTLRIVLYGKEILEYKNFLWDAMQSDPLFEDVGEDLSSDEQKRLTYLRYKKLLEKNLLTEEMSFQNPRKVLVYLNVLGMLDWSLSIKRSLSHEVFGLSVRAGKSMTEGIIDDLNGGKIHGCFALTEIAHGSNSRNFKTKATYDPKTDEFVLHSDSFTDWKCWVGNLGKTATHALVYAQLYTPDGICRGLHTFVVPVRDPTTLRTYPGIIAGDMGPKIGLNGLDNGFLGFTNYRIPRTSLLNRNANVTPDGRYESRIGDQNKRATENLGNLNMGRSAIMHMSVVNLTNAMIIAIRYAAVRRQFGPANQEEIPLLEYPLHQYRLLPYLAASVVLEYFYWSFYDDFVTFQVNRLLGQRGEKETLHGVEVHIVGSAGKPVISWLARDAIQECREACGGHGYLKCSGIGDLRNDNDANLTYEGDNNVLLQQTSNYLLSILQQKQQGQVIKSPLGCLNFMENMDEILQRKCNLSLFITAEEIVSCYEWLVSYLLRESSLKSRKELAENKDPFTARNKSQVFHCHTLSIAFFEYFAFQRYFNLLRTNEMSADCLAILQKLGILYGAWSLNRHVATFYLSGFFDNPQPVNAIRNTILKLCNEVKDDAVALVDVIAPPDFFIKSILGKSDGQIYNRLANALLTQSGSLSRPNWWREISKKSSKL